MENQLLSNFLIFPGHTLGHPFTGMKPNQRKDKRFNPDLHQQAVILEILRKDVWGYVKKLKKQDSTSNITRIESAILHTLLKFQQTISEENIMIL